MLIKSENYVNVLGFMVTPESEGGLGLKGNELLVYATIYGFSQDDKSWFRGSLRYLAEWCNGTKQGVQKNLTSLLEKGLIVKRDDEKFGVKFCEYRTTKVDGMQQSCIPEQQSLPHIYRDNIDSPSVIDSNESITSPPKGKSSFVKPTIDEIRTYCAEKGYSIDAEQFWHHYESNGWRVGRVPMKSWRSALVTWNKNRTVTNEPKKGLREG